VKVTNVRLNYVGPKKDKPNKLKAYAKVTLDHQLIINAIKVIDSGQKRHLVFPERVLDSAVTAGERVTISLVNPIVSELRKHMTDAVFEAFDADPANPANEKKETE
jgi:DNA-binding cell septation regulator SpoVG